MLLTEAQQERYARHLLLEGLGGEGQERLLSSCVRVRGTGRAARWAARYLAVSGVGGLLVDDPAAARECLELSQDVRILDARTLDRDPDLTIDLAGQPPAASRQPPAEEGAMAALRAVRHLVRP
ncbi:MAG: hypothetical protein ACJ79H_09160 [Myxococcales bacterium]